MRGRSVGTLGCAVLIAAVASWASSSTPSPAAAPSAPSAPAVAEAFQPHVRSLTRPLHVWHYAQRTRLGLEPAGHLPAAAPELGPYLRGRFGRYWDLSLNPYPDATVSGLYVAADPVASRAWGGSGDGWALVELVLPRGFRIVDVRAAGGGEDAPPLPAATVATLAAAGCEARTTAGLLTMLESRACRAAAVETMAELDVDGILYDFRTQSYAACPGRPPGAFILVRAEAVDITQARLLVREPSPDAAAEQRRRVQGLFAKAREAGSRRTLPWPELPAAAPEGLDAWMAEHLFGCGAYPEDLPPRPGEDAMARRHAEVAAQPASPRARYHLASALAAGGRLTEAVVEYEEALRLDPDHVEALTDLAWLRAASDPALRDPARAVALAERLVGITQYRDRFAWPKITKTRHSMVLAAAYAAAGDFERALGYAHHARELTAKQHADSGTPLTARLLVEAERRLALYQAHQPYRPPETAAAVAATGR